ncbi:histidine phosphatase family protein [Microbacterium sp. Se63.02b]|uniref:histidine phosphatase family protein n=1 Tax=Microbacterium sp. Se63.02b TaxID=2709304 RepID=UPI001604D473|nr:histidine phosphatase family protein [Microbacterium sp. Se63.02b]QNA93637.1 hypothetical protein G4G29_17440 [Microbacterium sp. Se63.02b]
MLRSPPTVARRAQRAGRASPRRAWFSTLRCRRTASGTARRPARCAPRARCGEDAGWREACFGTLEGARSATLARRLAHHRDAADPLRAVLTELSASAGGEHPDAVVARALAALDRAADDGDEVLVVTSGVTILLLLDALGADLDHVVAGPANLSVSTVEGGPGRWCVTRAVDQAM